MMRKTTTVIGIDPGETVGVVDLAYENYPETNVWTRYGIPLIFQCHHQSLPFLLHALIKAADGAPVIISHERYVANLRAAKSRKASAGQITRDINGGVGELPKRYPNVRLVEHTAAQVKSWFSAEKLAALNITLPAEMRHARDGVAQAAFAATHDLGAPDPLSKRVAALPDGPPSTDALKFTAPQAGLYSDSEPVHDVLRRAIDAQSPGGARYIGLERGQS